MAPVAQSFEEIAERLRPELHVLVVLLSEAWGGLEQTALNDVRLLMQQGIRVTLLIRARSPIEQRVRQESPQIHLIAVENRPRNYFDRKIHRLILQSIDERAVNLVHLHQTSLLGSIVPPLLRRPHVALVVSRHILNSHNKKDPIHALLYRRVDYVLVLSQTMRRNLATTMPVPEKKLRIVNLAIDLAKFHPRLVSGQPKREEWGIGFDEFVVGLVGRIDPMKGQDLLIKALAQVRKTHGRVRAVIIGDETPGLEGRYLADLNESIRQLHLEDVIQIFPAQGEVASVMAALDLFVMPSWSEAFGLVAVEAMAMEIPCILGRGGSAEEMALASGAELVRPGDAYDLARKIIFLHNSPEVRKEMGRKGREYVLAHHCREVRIGKTLDVYSRCYRRRIYGDPHFE
jgi:glycosyltransferase involved in cell wall biosynthesis